MHSMIDIEIEKLIQRRMDDAPSPVKSQKAPVPLNGTGAFWL
ncbi:hypothetical protein HBHAL_4484 [Halobacillus halophilus DSM 2266]|uniref:Uncharacterized protein n=1 Tax=Halobacillus halophilus (strain ATCC 35676 / DSM 2266 / JCM 20832 / KCTC 3685 / LMG 17431 / NBRC 102448 / NCIMB 2269) TaxID=866895 RepID=I0JRQ3_HALH3|nr:hypothetical protein HBHAL_4484 [Halobacillus halophilus DSM 2266]